MIPKKIHYCWLSDEKFPPFIKECMDTWHKIMPDYEMILWDKNRFDVNSVTFVKEAYEAKKWAFAADYIRLFALYNEGGIYLDTDVLVGKKFDDFLKHDFFTSLEFKKKTEYKISPEVELKRNPYSFQAAIMGATAGHPFLKDCMNWYENNRFFMPDGSFRGKHTGIAPDIYATVAQKYGFEFNNPNTQHLENGMVVFSANYFPSIRINVEKTSYAVHCCEGGWIKKSFWTKLRQKIITNSFLRKIFAKKEISLKKLCEIMKE